MFDHDPHLLPKDVVVMTPDIEVYAPYIHAVFEAQTDERLRIPFGIADQSARKQSRMIDGFFSLLDLKGSRLSAVRVMQLLEFAGIKEKFRLTEADIQTAERWIRDTRIRWGIDNQSRRQLGLPAVSENTWQAGIQRLLLGYAMPGNDQRMFGEILPYDNIEGNEVHSFGKFLEFADRVFCCINALSRPQQLKQWRTVLKRLLDDFFLPNEETEREIQSLRHLIDDLADRQTQTGFEEKIEVEPIHFYLNQRLDKQSFGSGFMTGGVTFCAMLPMRSIPFKVICLVGMNSDMFPRDFQPLTFDLIAQHPRPGDRSRRNDDKYLFLESLISARNTLYISYVGQGIQDNSRMPPSVLVSELLDTIEQGFDAPNRNILKHVVTFHRLQAFSPQYFRQDTNHFSYSEENRVAAACLHKPAEPALFITGAMPLTPQQEEVLRQPEIETLCSFFSNPAKFFLQQRLGIYLKPTATLPAKRENFELNFLDQYQVGQNLVSTRLKGMDLNDFRPVQKAMGHLPHGNVGQLYYNKMSIDVEKFVSNIEPFMDKKISETSGVNMEIAGFHLKGRLPEIYQGGLIHFRYARQRASDLLRSWIYHLIFCDVAQKDWTQNSILIFKDCAWQFNPTANSREILSELLDVFWQGLEEPIHFFPISALEYFQQLQKKGKSRPTALARARAKWMVTDFARGESEDPYYDICFKGTDPLDESFQVFAETVFEPLLANCTQLVV
jgi:exodeoxyribonuclease V gamma subunit